MATITDARCLAIRAAAYRSLVEDRRLKCPLWSHGDIPGSRLRVRFTLEGGRAWTAPATRSSVIASVSIARRPRARGPARRMPRVAAFALQVRLALAARLGTGLLTEGGSWLLMIAGARENNEDRRHPFRQSWRPEICCTGRSLRSAAYARFTAAPAPRIIAVPLGRGTARAPAIGFGRAGPVPWL